MSEVCELLYVCGLSCHNQFDSEPKSLKSRFYFLLLFMVGFELSGLDRVGHCCQLKFQLAAWDRK